MRGPTSADQHQVSHPDSASVKPHTVCLQVWGPPAAHGPAHSNPGPEPEGGEASSWRLEEDEEEDGGGGDEDESEAVLLPL